MQGSRAMLGLVIAMGVLILAGTATLIGVVVHRMAHPQPAAAIRPATPDAAAGPDLLVAEPPGTRIASIARQSDTLLSILLQGGGPDRIVIWDIAAGRRLTGIRLAP